MAEVAVEDGLGAPDDPRGPQSHRLPKKATMEVLLFFVGKEYRFAEDNREVRRWIRPLSRKAQCRRQCMEIKKTIVWRNKKRLAIYRLALFFPFYILILCRGFISLYF